MNGGYKVTLGEQCEQTFLNLKMLADRSEEIVYFNHIGKQTNYKKLAELYETVLNSDFLMQVPSMS